MITINGIQVAVTYIDETCFIEPINDHNPDSGELASSGVCGFNFDDALRDFIEKHPTPESLRPVGVDRREPSRDWRQITLADFLTYLSTTKTRCVISGETGSASLIGPDVGTLTGPLKVVFKSLDDLVLSGV